jgi:SAM-dependent methyltransferase
MMSQTMAKEHDRWSSIEGIGREREIYTSRFSLCEERAREGTWRILVEDFLKPYIRESDTVVDLGAGDGHFIRNVKAARRVAIDLSEHVTSLEQFGIEVLQIPATEIFERMGASVDVIMMSNFLEHLPDKRVLVAVLEECRKCLRSDGRLLIFQPNVTYVGARYWDYIDHHIALNEHSLSEALEICGYKIDRLIPRFLPYTAKSPAGRIAAACPVKLVRLYLRIPLLWRIFGQQTFVAASKR